MSKYDALSARLAAHPDPEWGASFAELEEVLGFPLPKGARSGKAWWGEAQPHARAWRGWDVSGLDPAGGRVTFRRASAGPGAEGKFQPPTTVDEPPILKRLDVSPGWGMAMVAGGVALAAGLGALAIRGLVRRRR